eukprot:TRINITY_DN405_c0_g1_i6.p1 TRINITY_DN405_c0_g1~~TRINITY_DN405_c0_g1_i6.p1  ORF type:complete len:414 (-),score=24.83 TRINITY_DN405_c0_g1_i6:59-1300(-)
MFLSTRSFLCGYHSIIICALVAYETKRNYTGTAWCLIFLWNKLLPISGPKTVIIFSLAAYCSLLCALSYYFINVSVFAVVLVCVILQLLKLYNRSKVQIQDHHHNKSLSIGLVFYLLIHICATWQAMGTLYDHWYYPPLGDRILIETETGRHLHLYCLGEGNMTLLLDAGLPFTSVCWSRVMASEKLRMLSLRYCSFDRAGYGWSDPSDEVKGIKGPFIYVGWSFGGFQAQYYRYMHPTDIAGLVLIDSCYHNMTKNISFENDLNQALILTFLTKHLASIGGMRIPGFFGLVLKEAGAPSTTQSKIDQARTNAIIYSPLFSDTAYRELDAFRKSEELVASAVKDGFGDTPIVVLLSQEGEAYSEALAYLSTRRRILKTQSDHYVPYNDPDSIVDAIEHCLSLITHSSEQITTQ